MNENIERLCLVARRLGPLREQVVFLGGAPALREKLRRMAGR